MSNLIGQFISKRPRLEKRLARVAEWLYSRAGYRELGLRRDDLISEENPVVRQALKRLPPKEAYDRVFRIRRAVQLDMMKQILPKAEHTTREQDYPYLSLIIDEVQQSQRERSELDNTVIALRRRPDVRQEAKG